MAPNSIIIFVIDRLRPMYLGPYGNTWSETPTMDEFASQSLLAEHCLTDSDDLTCGYRTIWHGGHAAVRDSEIGSLVTAANQVGLKTVLLSDEPALEAIASDEPFQEQLFIPQSDGARSAGSVEDTQFADLAATALDWLERNQDPVLLWVHARGLSGVWDAPQEMRTRLLGDDDPAAPEFLEPPHRCLSGEADPDELFALSVAYAAQVQVIDDCLFPVIRRMGDSRYQEATWALTSTRGYPLGEHGVIGSAGVCAGSENLQVPLMVRLPDENTAAGRVQAVVQSTVLYHSLCEILGQKRPGFHSLADQWLADRPSLAMGVCSQGGCALRTPSWHLAKSDTGATRLYAKPDDTWESNDVADLCPEVVALMESQMERFSSGAIAVELDEVLFSPHD